MEKSFEEKSKSSGIASKSSRSTYAYGECVLRRDAEGMARLFTEDGSADFSSLGWGVHQGHEAIKKLDAGTRTYRVKPFFTNHYIEFIDQTHARGWCWLDNRAARDGESLIGCGKIYDEYQLADGHWRFSSRRIVQFFLVLLKRQGLEQGTRGIDGLGTALALNVRRTYGDGAHRMQPDGMQARWDAARWDAARWDAARCRRTGAARRRPQRNQRIILLLRSEAPPFPEARSATAKYWRSSRPFAPAVRRPGRAVS